MDEKTFQKYISDKDFALKEAKKAFAKFLIIKVVEYAAIALIAYETVKLVNELDQSKSEIQ